MSQLSRRRPRERDEDERPSAREYSDEDRDEYRPHRRSNRRATRDEDEYYDDPPWNEDEDTDEGDTRSSRRSGRSSSSRERPSRDRDREPSRSRSRPRERDRDRDRDEDANVSRGRGWDSYGEARAKKAAGAKNRLQVKDKEVVVKFLEEEPFAIYEQHWVGQRSYTCPEENKCPLCDAGYDTRTLALFNVVNMETAENLFWEAGPQAGKRIKSASEKKSSTPINRDGLYFAINRKKQSNGFFDYELDAIKEDELEEYYKLEPLTDSELDDALDKLFDDSVIPVTSRRDLVSVADSDDE